MSSVLLGPPGSRHLGAALDRLTSPGSAFDPGWLATLDEREAFPAEACAALDGLGLARQYVPAEHGGDLVALDELCEAVRAVARHDLTVAIAHGKTFLGAVSVWVAGTAEQAAGLAERIAAGAVVSWGLTERGHGSDLLAGELSATRTPSGSWRLEGGKWLINNATRAGLICVLARTRPAGGARGFSLLLVDKAELRPGSYTYTDKIRTHGIRGADISGITFHGAEVPASALVGEEGGGAETVLKALQLTRTACGALSLGAGDHALGLARTFAAGRELYGRPLAELPFVRRELADIAAGLLLAEATLVVGARTAHTAPDELSVVSAITKAFVPENVQRAVDRAAEILGTRAFLTDVHAHGAMARLDRDHRIVAVFDGTTLVNRSALISQFPALARTRREPAGVPAAARLDQPLPKLDPGALRLVARAGSTVVRALPAAAAAAPDALAEPARRLAAVSDALHADLARHRPGSRDVPAEAFALAERYELVHAGAAALHLWLANPRRRDEPLWRDGLWARAAVGHALARLGAGGPAPDTWDQLAGHLLAGGRPVSLLHRKEPE
ncbi:acyl-CoA dehydrogenase family protein [Micromonospora sp. NPDC048843]|uniref:acyl-CoA dehydrogenase family protein n=1 Tax=Micromonospora sp. NPDC048843 TaxID=3155389 RepID=UPI0033F6A789